MTKRPVPGLLAGMLQRAGIAPAGYVVGTSAGGYIVAHRDTDGAIPRFVEGPFRTHAEAEKRVADLIANPPPAAAESLIDHEADAQGGPR